jgi:hypothetical protein
MTHTASVGRGSWARAPSPPGATAQLTSRRRLP